MTWLYADDSKIMCAIHKEDSQLSLQADIDKLVDWTRTWEMFFNVKKCKIMHFGKNNVCQAYTMEDVTTGESLVLETTTEERDLGIHISNKLKWETQCIAASSKANRALGLLKNMFTYLNIDLMRKLYCCYVRPLIEFASPAGSPYFKKGLLENVQRRVTRIPFETKGLCYHERLKLFGLQTLEERRTRGDCIQQYKIVKKLENVNWQADNASKSINTDGTS